MKLRSQEVRALAPENDPLKIGMGWSADDLSKPQILIESTFGDSHPGSAHLDQFVRESARAVNEHGGKAARYFATDMCDGIAQGHDGINYSLPHREAMIDLVEAQANASVYDGGVFIASCDKSVPAMLMSIGRLKDMSAIVVTGGVMEAHTLPKEYTVNDPACKINELLTLEQIGKFDAWEKTGVIPEKQLDYYKHHACPRLRRVFLYGHRLHHADHGGSAGSDAPRHGPHARHRPRAETGRLRRGRAAHEAGGKRPSGKGYRHPKEL